jgi:F0F1-type ATP synthase membrane subunit b/b'
MRMTQILEQLEINKTFLYQFVLFGAFFFVLSVIYLKPFQKLIQKRNHKLKNDLQGASDLLKVVESRLSDYERALAASRTESRVHYEKVVSDVRAKEDAAIAGFKDDLKKDYMKITQQLMHEKANVEAELEIHASQMADAVAQKILGK